MITIVDYALRENAEGEEFCALIVEGGLEMVRSSITGRHYATAKRASVNSTFTEERCKQLIGTKVPGSIQRVDCEPYEFIRNEGEEPITLEHRWVYVPPVDQEMEKVVFEEEEVLEKEEIPQEEGVLV